MKHNGEIIHHNTLPISMDNTNLLQNTYTRSRCTCASDSGLPPRPFHGSTLAGFRTRESGSSPWIASGSLLRMCGSKKTRPTAPNGRRSGLDMGDSCNSASGLVILCHNHRRLCEMGLVLIGNSASGFAFQCRKSMCIAPIHSTKSRNILEQAYVFCDVR